MKEQYLNSRPVFKSCSNCGHCLPETNRYLGREFDHCRLSGMYCQTERAFNSKCDKDFSGWTPIPPEPPKPERRSLRQWLYDIFLK